MQLNVNKITQTFVVLASVGLTTVYIHAGWRRDNASLAAGSASAGAGRARCGADAVML